MLGASCRGVFFGGAELGPMVACMLSEEASKQTSLCWGVGGLCGLGQCWVGALGSLVPCMPSE